MGMKYIGDGAFVPNIPARNLSDDEVKEFGAATLLKTGLYVPVEIEAIEAEPEAEEEGEA